MPEFVRHGETGFVYDTADELTGLLERLARDPDLVATMGSAGRRVAEQEYDLRVAGAAMLAVYEALLRKRAA